MKTIMIRGIKWLFCLGMVAGAAVLAAHGYDPGSGWAGPVTNALTSDEHRKGRTSLRITTGSGETITISGPVRRIEVEEDESPASGWRRALPAPAR